MLAPDTGVALLAVVVAGLFLAAVRRARPRAFGPAVITLIALMAVQWILADRGVLAQWHRTPPPLMVFVVVMTTITIITAIRLGPAIVAEVPLWAIVATQVFRLPLEIVMHRAAELGVMPVVMSYSGFNFDVVTGASAIVVALLMWARRAPRWLIVLWNLMGSVLLATIVTIAILATPMFAAFGADQVNTWVTTAPVVWLPGVLVQAALFAHVVLWRALASRRV